MVRGGSWNNNPQNLRVSNRNNNTPTNRNNNVGFRCAREGGRVGVTPPVARAAAIPGAAGVRSPRLGPDPAVTEDPPSPGPRPSPSAPAGAPARRPRRPDELGRDHGQRRPHHTPRRPHLPGHPASPRPGSHRGRAEVVTRCGRDWELISFTVGNSGIMCTMKVGQSGYPGMDVPFV